MEEQTNNVGGQAMGQANVMPSQIQGVSSQAFLAAPTSATTPASNDPQTPSLPQTPVMQQPQTNEKTQNQNNNDVSLTTSPATAEDSDLIEKEWIEKAKSIVEKTRKDPFLQSQGLNQLKAEYLQKRYGKNLGADGK